MSKFKAGDRVRILDSNGSDLRVGSEHVIDKSCRDRYRIGCFYFHNEHLALVEQKPEFKVGHGAICIKKTHGHNVGDVLLVTNINNTALLDFGGDFAYSRSHFTPCPNPPRPHYKERIAHALGADIEFKAPNGSWVENNIPSFLYSVEYRVAIPDQDPNAEKREQLKAKIKKLQSELDNLGGDL